ncbi:LuxR C-terminal-related transcriptional regulator [Streptomyces sp. NPDC085932]|uniref:helix-turn-helix transcriptional regulator n=1 Tax=Streptomyces sp. NPDC085932 TaxID=3365741 RepID=UPI0037D099FA
MTDADGDDRARVGAYWLCELSQLQESEDHAHELHAAMNYLVNVDDAELDLLVTLEEHSYWPWKASEVDDSRLTKRERCVIMLVLRGLTNREVAKELYVSVKTVEYHLGNIYKKLNVTSRRALRRLLAPSTDTEKQPSHSAQKHSRSHGRKRGMD